MKTHFLNLIIDPSQIHFLNSIIESYGGIANVRTVDAAAGMVQLWVMPGFINETLAVINDISDSIKIKEMTWGETMYAG